MTYLDQAYSRLLAGLAKARPAEIGMWPTAQDFEAQAEQIMEWNRLWVDFLRSVAIDGASNAPAKAINAEVTGFVGDAMSDFAHQFTEAAEKLREDEPGRSDFEEYNTHHRAYSGV